VEVKLLVLYHPQRGSIVGGTDNLEYSSAKGTNYRFIPGRRVGNLQSIIQCTVGSPGESSSNTAHYKKVRPILRLASRNTVGLRKGNPLPITDQHTPVPSPVAGRAGRRALWG